MERFVGKDLSGAEFRACDLRDVRFTGVEMINATIDGEVENLVINGVEVSEYVGAELDRRHPVRPLLRSEDPDELRRAWATLRADWDATIATARTMPPGTERASVRGEWSLVQTLRHLVMATDSWFRRGVLGLDDPFWPAGMGWSEMPRGLVAAIDHDADPSFDEVLAVHADRMAEVADYLDTVDRATLLGPGAPLDGSGWPPPDYATNVLRCIHIVMNETWWHRQFAERDLAALAVT